MLFNSFSFIFVFLPACLLVFALTMRFDRSMAIPVLTAFSLVFYIVWLPYHFVVLFASICVNFGIARLIVRQAGRTALIAGIAVNIVVLAYFKYSGFLAENVARLLGSPSEFVTTAIPLALSFHTFQQIAFLVDCRRGRTRPETFQQYLFFVAFFPQLVAGPIVHFRDFAPQIPRLAPVNAVGLASGLTLFLMGLFKKLVLADNVQPISDQLFNNVYFGISPRFTDAWTGVLAYTCQIYFDFSGYSDMALGLARIFGIRLPINFDSPYKASSISDFWRRWHITLSHFLRDYLYIPLGGNRRGSMTTYRNFLLVMVLGGLWHGAAWTFVLWGLYHGMLLAVGHAFASNSSARVPPWRKVLQFFAPPLTFLAVATGWVLFRAQNIEVAGSIYLGMLGLNEPGGQVLMASGSYVLVGILLSIAFVAPNSQQIMRRYSPALSAVPCGRNSLLEKVLGTSLRWRPTISSAVGMSLVALGSWSYLGGTSKFLYFQF